MQTTNAKSFHSECRGDGVTMELACQAIVMLCCVVKYCSALKKTQFDCLKGAKIDQTRVKSVLCCKSWNLLVQIKKELTVATD